MHWIAWPLPPTPTDSHTDPGVALLSATAGPRQPLPQAPHALWWALQFTPRVASVEGEALLLEVSATERLWGGREALLAQLQLRSPPWPAEPPAATGNPSHGPVPQECPAARCPTPFAEAPTSLQALALLRLQLAGQPLPRHLPDGLPLHTLTALHPHLPSLARMGCRTWGALRALPRDGVARRLGAAVLLALDRAYGHIAHNHAWVELPERFELTAELPALATSADALLWSASRLLSALQAWLQARQQGVLALELAWRHDLRRVDGVPIAPWHALPVRTAQPTHELAHLRRLLAENLARTPLAAPANQITLRALETAPLPHASAHLLPPDGSSAAGDQEGEAWHQLVERLSARLGAGQVQSVTLLADHRPECMQRWQPMASTASGTAVAKVPHAAHAPEAVLWPTWLLRTPQRLDMRGHRPCYQGPLSLLAGPHRFDAAWWEEGACAQPTGENDGSQPPESRSGLVQRDYFVALSPVAGRVWIFRERLAHAPAGASRDRWFLQGLYA
ncbi:DNA polymerase Y family protein [Acidovorax sp. LjRoot118]|uniref:Y-family DNA polymerase n=1 Tax=Acidovorax sp. LjRoot118 TaxID=3342256 RepID=UPI003ECF8250